ncbi:MAG TPA: discoidin domain-containing protein [Catenuloplanes sp.]|jgi:lysophospholipase L1-like esterase
MSIELRRWRGVLLAVLMAAAALVAPIVVTPAVARAGTDLAQGKPATTASAQSGRAAALGNDGNDTTRWCAANGAVGHWWQVDLGAATDLTGTEVRWEFARNYRYHVQTSLDGSTWTMAADRTTDTGATQTRTDPFTARARYLRITVTGLPTATWASFYTVRVFGADANPPVDGPTPDPALRAQCTGTAPIYCHYALPPGHYDVTVVLGDSRTAGSTAVQAEARRSMLATVNTAAGQTSRHTFTVNVRDPEGQPTGQGGPGTPGLDLYFVGTAPRLAAIGVAPVRHPVLYLAGDSTVCDQPAAPYAAWGQMLPERLRRGLSVANYADSGESSASFLRGSALFLRMEPLLRQGDHVLIQFGHNDKKATAAEFNSSLTTLIGRVQDMRAVPILVTPPVRRHFAAPGRLDAASIHTYNGVGTNLHAEMLKVAAAENVPLIDLTTKSKQLVEGLGEAASAEIFLRRAVDGVEDNTHFSTYGAQRMTDLVVDGLRELGITPITGFLR